VPEVVDRELLPQAEKKSRIVNARKNPIALMTASRNIGLNPRQLL
jgi:hypothetical protein